MLVIIFKVVCRMLWGILYFVLIVFASFGFAVLMNAVCKHLLYPFTKRRCVITVIPFGEEHNDMETAVSFFVKYSESGACHYVVILDEGLSETGLECARLLTEKYPNVLLCNGENLYSTVECLNSAVLDTSAEDG